MKMIKKGMMVLACCAIFSIVNTANAQTLKSHQMKKKILFVVTSHDKKGSTGAATGYYLGEVSHAWKVLKEAGYEMDFVSPKGGNPPVDGFDLSDAVNKEFWEDEVYHQKISNSHKPSEVKAEDYTAIYYAGGHGAVWDLPDNQEIAALATKIYENNGVVSAVCHGPAGLVNIRLSNGKFLIDGKKVSGFTNEEEIAVKLEKVVPFLLEDQLKARGGIYEKSAAWQEHVVTDQRLVTGQNPQSAKAVGEAVKKALENL
ncbi:type 1 glutamine amidotransferase domain-containing protein [Pedobacter steynii]|nr:type 1 glutamine amidotransferase domain-containing protein [Pedobacter steynii]NQX39371.1 type 1 glutamine amidotransferase domain-containing protein [Pedobacter steynii]